jgi:hypothetical protein
MTRAPLPSLLVLASALLASCSPSSSDTGSAQFAVSMRQELAASIARVSVTSSAADIPSVTVNLAPTGSVWGGIIGNIPAGSNRSFLAQAFDSAGTLLFEGSASGVTISANQTTVVAITLQQMNAPPPFENEAPVIDSLVASSTTVPTGGSMTLQATVHDPNPGDTLFYGWSATAGTFSTPTLLSVSWTAPATPGTQTLTFTVTDSAGLSSLISLAVNVTQGGGEGDAQLDISFNSSPLVAALSAAPTQLAVGQTTSVSVSASDPDGDSLSYSWSATCAGSWSNASSSSAQFTPTELPGGACNNCRLTVAVSDGRGGQTPGTVALCVSNTPPVSHVAPVIVRSYRSSDTATAGQMLTYEVDASDPQNSSLTFSWSASTGTLGTPQNSASASRMVWTAPTCVPAGTSASIVATVTNAYGLSTARTFGVTGVPACAVSGWAPTGPMASRRMGFTATLLTDGKVLVSGGSNGSSTVATAEMYDPASGTWSATGSMNSPRDSHTATLLPDGKVLVTGGYGFSNVLETAEVYDPATGSWTLTGFMSIPRDLHMATLLPNGKVLISGGRSRFSNVASAEVYDPASGTWSPTGSMASVRRHHTSTLLPSGKVLITGGDNGSGIFATAEVYDPTLGTWSTTGSMATARNNHRATLLSNGKVLITGGCNLSSCFATAEVYDPVASTWSTAGSMASPRTEHTATLLSNGTVLVAGGNNFSADSATADVYDPVAGTWSATGSMATDRYNHTATLLPNGKVLAMGGYAVTSGFLATAEVYTP